MRKYLVNYRVDISATSTIPYLEYTAIYDYAWELHVVGNKFDKEK